RPSSREAPDLDWRLLRIQPFICSFFVRHHVGPALSSLRIERSPCRRHALRRVVPAMLERAGDQAIVGIHGRGTTNSGPWSTRQALHGMLRGDRLMLSIAVEPAHWRDDEKPLIGDTSRMHLQAGAALHDAAV